MPLTAHTAAIYSILSPRPCDGSPETLRDAVRRYRRSTRCRKEPKVYDCGMDVLQPRETGGTGELVGREGGEGCCTAIVNLGR